MHETSEIVWLDAHGVLTLPELAEVCALQVGELQELVEVGALKPLQRDETACVFSAEVVMPLRKASQLRCDFDLDLFTAGLLLEHLLRIDALEIQVRALQMRMEHAP
ncbi:chaperone modulator CbpM (plasmid) [Acidovorax sp. DW039]|uniref:chaperone modulator CbpM n=1 Tax=Acidovorax sp. DW039 TaxID=3095606 RepID=UPI0030927DE0|nr:chaperone modulator CbpM [Acidovorax sp. DW039]